MFTAFKQYLLTLNLSPVSRKLYLADVRHFLSWLVTGFSSPIKAEPTLDQLSSAGSYSRYVESLRLSAMAPSMLKRTIASLRQFGTFLSLTYGITNPMSTLSVTSNPTSDSISQSTLNYIKHFTNYLIAEHLSPSTIKSYKSDVTRYLDWTTTNLPGTEIAEVLTDKNIKIYLKYLSQLGESRESTIERKVKSIGRFNAWYTTTYGQSLKPDNNHNTKIYLDIPNIASKLESSDQNGLMENLNPGKNENFVKKDYSRKSRAPLFPYITSRSVRNFATIIVLMIFAASLGIFGYRQFTRDATLTSAFPSTPVTPNRQLSFQGRLENASGTPISTATDMTFKLYDASTAGTQLYTTGICSITPDTDGVFSTQIGDTCGSAISSSVFTENANVWLEVTVGSGPGEILDPRQQIASVAYALNSETLQGFPISSTVSAIRNTVVPMNQWGEIIVGEQSPRLTGVSGTFAISAPAISITTAVGSNGNITLAPDGTGQVNINGNTTSTNFFNISNAQLTTGSLITGTAANNNTGFKLIDLSSGSSPTSKFSVTDAGLTTIGADLYLDSGLSTFGTAVSDDTIEATKFCTGDGETNCVNDFSTFATGTNYWTRSSGNISPLTLNDTISATTSAATALTVTQTGAFNALLVEDQASDSTPFIIDQSGKVGIGTTTPFATLTVTGDGASTEGILASDVITDNSIKTGRLKTYSYDIDEEPVTLLIGYARLTENQLVYGGSSASENAITEHIWRGADTVNTLTGSEWMRLDTGKLSLGTNAPDARFEINDATGDNLRLTYNDSDGSATAYTDFSLASDGDLTIDSAGGAINLGAGDDLNLTAAGDLIFGGNTSLSETTSPTDSGAYLIGVNDEFANSANTNVQAILNDLDAAIAGIGTNYWTRSSGNISPLSLNDTISATTSAATALTVTQTGAFNALLVEDQASDTTPFVIDASGNVGVGDPSPDHKLDVAGNIGLDASSYINWSDTDGTTGYGFRDNSGTLEFKNSAGAWAAFGTGSGSGSNWRINLGSLSPLNDTLDLLVGSIATESAKAGFINIANGTPTATVSAGAAGGAFLSSTGTLATTAKQSLAIGNTTTGNINIGTDATVRTLTMGNITGASAVNVNTGTGGTTYTTTNGIYTLATGTGAISLGNTASAKTINIGGTTNSGTDAVNIATNATAADVITIGNNHASTTTAITGGTAWSMSTAGNLIANNLTINGNSTLGNAITDNITFTGRVALDSDLIPIGTTGTNDLGSSSLPWDNIYVNSISLPTFTAGSVIFTGSSGVLTQDNPNFFWNDTSNRLGIGTLSPLATLDIRATLGTAPAASISGNTSMAALVVDQSGIGDLFTASKSGDTKFVITNAGNVGIGVAAPTNKLEIGGSTSTISNASGDITIDSASNNISFAGDSLINILNTYVSGELGIGLADAVGKLDVYGAVTGKALVILDEIGDQAIFTASASGISKFIISNAGKVGIGDITPDHLLDVAGNIGLDASSYINWGDTDGTTGYGFRDNSGTLEFKNSAGSWTAMGAGGASWWDQTSGTIQPYNTTVDLLLGGTATSSAKFAVLNMNSGTPTATISGNIIIGQGGYVGSQYGPLNLAYKSAPNTWTTGLSIQDTTGYVLATRYQSSTSVNDYLDPSSTGTSLSIQGNIISNGAFYLSSGNDANAVSIGPTGTGKLDAGTIDPPYTINGNKFATYIASMTGVKEETTGNIFASEYIAGTGYRATLDLANSPEGSDIWLFVKVTDLKTKLDQMVVLLSAAGNTKTWYDIDPLSGKLHLYSLAPTTISYRLTAPRFDAHTWLNTRGVNSPSEGHVVNDQTSWSVSESISNAINNGKSQINSIFGNVETNLISPLNKDENINIIAPVIIAPITTDTPALIVNGEIDASTISARTAILTDIQANNITARNIVADTISANHIEGLDAKLATISADLTDSEISTITDRIKARLEILTGNIPTALDLPVPLDSTNSTTEILNIDSSVATNSATLSSADIDFVTINNYLAVIGTATITTLDITNGLYTNSINSKDSLLAIQPMGGIINMANGTLVVDSNGQVAINGDIAISGKILADSAALNSLELGTPTASSSALGKLLAIYDEKGVAVATIDASGSANLADLTTSMITIASSANSATSSTELAGILATSTSSNATAGESILVSPNTELVIESPYVTANSLIYLTPTGNTDNKVVFVKSKNSCSKNIDDPTPCTPSFTVAIDLPASSDISFNWWIIQLAPPKNEASL